MEKTIQYCKNCILPSTRPNLFLDKSSSLCSVCKPLKLRKKKINWSKREEEFRMIANTSIKKNSIYDCIIPVSGGKDSTWQVLTALKYNLRPLALHGNHLLEII